MGGRVGGRVGGAGVWVGLEGWGVSGFGLGCVGVGVGGWVGGVLWNLRERCLDSTPRCCGHCRPGGSVFEGVGLCRDRRLGSLAPRVVRSAGTAGTVPFGAWGVTKVAVLWSHRQVPGVPRASPEGDDRRAAFFTADLPTVVASPGRRTPFDLSEGRLAGAREQDPKRAKLAECQQLPVPGFGSRFGPWFRRHPLDP